MSRRFVNLLVEGLVGYRPACMLHRVNPWKCFYPTTQQALELDPANNNDSTTTIEDARLPQAAVSFYKPLSPGTLGGTYLASFPGGGGSSSTDDGGDDVVVCTDQEGNTLLYDVAARAARVMPVPHAPKHSPVSLAVGDGLYLLNKEPGMIEEHPFEALIHRLRPECCEEAWYWRSLPPPPHADEEEEEENPYPITSYTVVGDSRIWISTARGGTFSFDTATGGGGSVWSVAGDWALPFDGRVQYAPELGLWFGFAPRGKAGYQQFAASDLSSVSATRPPVLQKSWDELAPPLPKSWVPMAAYLLPLGAGKFCIARMFDQLETKKRGNGWPITKSFAVLTGVEVERGSGGELRMIRHKSRRYTFGGSMAHLL